MNNSMKDKFELDTMINKIAWLGVPGLVLLIVMSFSPFYGGAAIMSSLALLGGPFGAIAGIGVLIIISKYGNKISEYGIEKVIVLVVKRMEKKGKSKSQIIDEIKKYKISDKLKQKIINYLDQVKLFACSVDENNK